MGFSALQRAEIAEIWQRNGSGAVVAVSVLFNEPKLLKKYRYLAQIASEMFQCSSTSRNC